MAADDEGFSFMKSNEGCVRLAIIVLLCVAYCMIAVVGYTEIVTWVMSVYIISWIFSLQTYFLIAAKVASHMRCGVAFDDVDICLSVFSFFQCLIASIVLAIYARSTTFWIIADALGFVVSLLYFIELLLLRENPPLNLKYLVGKNGVVKASIFVVGCTTFVLLYASAYQTCTDTTVTGCSEARTWVLAAYIYCWALSTILLFIRLINLYRKFGYFELFDMFWSGFSFFNYLIASIVLVFYLQCSSFNDFACGTRLASLILGFYVAVLYLVDLVLLKRKFGRVLDRNVFVSKPNTPNRSRKLPANQISR